LFVYNESNTFEPQKVKLKYAYIQNSDLKTAFSCLKFFAPN